MTLEVSLPPNSIRTFWIAGTSCWINAMFRLDQRPPEHARDVAVAFAGVIARVVVDSQIDAGYS